MVKINQEELDKKHNFSMKTAQQDSLEFTSNLLATVKLKVKRLKEDITTQVDLVYQINATLNNTIDNANCKDLPKSNGYSNEK